METIHLATGHAFEALGSVAILASLLFTAFELHHVGKAQRVGNLIAITRQHREIWSDFFDRPQLGRVLDPGADVTAKPFTPQERLFVMFLILHLNTSFQAIKARMLVTPQSLRKDIQWFFSLPIPKSVWEKAKAYQDEDFVRFVEDSRK